MSNPLPENSLDGRLAELEARLSGVERGTTDSWTVDGPRSDLSPTWGVRVRHGLLPDGFYGYETFSEDGKRCRNGKWAGETFWFAGSAPPENAEQADGTAVNGTTDKYLYLWRAIGTTYGGSGQSSFNKPNTRGRVPVGKATSGTFQTLGATGGAESDSDSGSVSAHTHTTPNHTHPLSTTSFSAPPTVTVVTDVLSGGGGTTGSGGGGSVSITVSTLQPYIVLLPVIAL